jgi:hypothetical protein
VFEGGNGFRQLRHHFLVEDVHFVFRDIQAHRGDVLVYGNGQVFHAVLR